MIARIALSPGSLNDLSVGEDIEATEALHELLLKAMQSHGALVLGTGADGTALLDQIRSQPPAVRKRWEVVMSTLASSRRLVRRQPPCEVPLYEIAELAQMRQLWTDQADVIVVDGNRAQQYGIAEPPNRLSDRPSALELATGRAARRSETIENFQALAERANHEQGAAREQFWREVLEPMARLSNEVVVLDRYLFRQLVQQDTGRRPAQPEHVQWLAEKLDATMLPGSRVVLLADDEAPADRSRMAPPRQVSAGELADTLRRAGGNRPWRRLEQVKIVVGPWRQRGSLLPHDRHIRFNINAAISIPQGFSRLSAPVIEDEDGLNWHYRHGASAVSPLVAAERRVQDPGHRGFSECCIR
ncbi:hypothetical protein [Pedococcus sp. 2YAF34]|uniref:hypothetical protein n=1 Tax=Pedococcus sp. 2YAF34 TaxID=3233032 RepID=UPI003F9E0694